MSPKFSIVIPTRQRHCTLFYALRSAMHQTFSDFEVIVMDNCSSAETREVVDQFDDPRCKYYRSDRRLAMHQNWEVGLTKASGEYIFVLGDDDALLPDALEIATQLFWASGARIVSWLRANYGWPDIARIELKDRLYLDLGQSYRFESCLKILKSVYDFRLPYEYLPTIYNSFVHRNIIDHIKFKYGRYFLGTMGGPDVCSGVMNAYHTDRYLLLERPLSIAGSSKSSTGLAQLLPDVESGAAQEYWHENKQEDIQLHSMLLTENLPQNLLLTITIADTLLKSKDQTFPDDVDLQLNLNNLLQCSQLYVRSQEQQDYLQVLALRYHLTLEETMLESPFARQGPLMDDKGQIIQLGINCEYVGVTDVEAAARLAWGILPLFQKPLQLIPSFQVGIVAHIDWHQDQNSLYHSLESLLQTIVQHPQQSFFHLFITCESNFELANTQVSSVMLNLIQQGIEFSLEVSLSFLSEILQFPSLRIQLYFDKMTDTILSQNLLYLPLEELQFWRVITPVVIQPILLRD